MGPEAPGWRASGGSSAPDLDALHLRLSLLALGQGHGQNTVPEAGIDLVLLDLVAERNAPLEAAIDALGELPVLVLGLGALLSPERQHAVIERDLDILFLDTRNLGCYGDLLVVIGNLDARPAATECGKTAKSRQARAKAPESVVEQPVHLAMQRKERIAIALAENSRGLVAGVAAPWNQITHIHLSLLSVHWIGKAIPMTPDDCPAPCARQRLGKGLKRTACRSGSAGGQRLPSAAR